MAYSAPMFSSPILGPIPVSLHDILDFGKLSPSEQLQVIELLKGFIEQIQAMDCSHLPVPGTGPEVDGKMKKDHLISHNYWLLVKFLRYSTPCRIQEATPYLTFILKHYEDVNGKHKKDLTPLLYLGVALSKTRGKAQKALEVFNEAFGYTLESPGLRTELWSRAYMSRLLRRMDRVPEAETQEELIRDWLLGHPYSMLPSLFEKLVTDETDTQKNYILSDPKVKTLLGSMVEKEGGVVVHIDGSRTTKTFIPAFK